MRRLDFVPGARYGFYGKPSYALYLSELGPSVNGNREGQFIEFIMAAADNKHGPVIKRHTAMYQNNRLIILL